MKRHITFMLREKGWGYIYRKKDFIIPEYVLQILPINYERVIWFRGAKDLDFENENFRMACMFSQMFLALLGNISLEKYKGKSNETLPPGHENAFVSCQCPIMARQALTGSRALMVSVSVNVATTLESFGTTSVSVSTLPVIQHWELVWQLYS